MKFQLITAITATLAGTTVAAPGTSAATVLEHAKRQGGENICTGYWQGDPSLPTSIRWVVNFNSPVTEDRCGAGYLDNYRGRCGEIVNWECTREDGANYYRMVFFTQPLCTAFDITEATRAASQNGVVVDCVIEVPE